MKIGLFTDTYWPQVNGVATSVLMLKEQMELKGHEVHVVTTTDPAAPKKEHNVHRVYSVPFVSKRRVGSIYNPKLRKKIDAFNLDIIHTHTEFSLGRFGRAIAKQNNIVYVHTMHTIYEDYTHFIVKSGHFDGVAKAFARKVSSQYCNSADHVIVPTTKVREKLINYGVTSPMEVIPTGIDLQRFRRNYPPEQREALRQRYGIGPGDILLSYIGRVSIEKNIAELLHGLHQYLPAHPNVKLMIVGDGPARKNLEELVEYLDIQGQVVFTGEVPWDDVGIYYTLGELFINASRSEAQGLTYIEALASGLPLLVRDDPCVDEVIQAGVNGYTYIKQQQFLSTLDNLVENPEKRARMSKAAKISVQKWSAEQFATKVLGLYSGLLAEPQVCDDARQPQQPQPHPQPQHQSHQQPQSQPQSPYQPQPIRDDQSSQSSQSDQSEPTHA